jgi:hypothetical protein
LEKRSGTAEASPPSADELERILAPPVEVGRALFDRYTALMLEARSLLSQGEFEKLNRVR